MTAWIGLIILILTALVLMLRGDTHPIGGLEPGDFASLMTGVALLIFIGGGTLLSYRGKGAQAIKDISVWLAIMLALVTLYSFRTEFKVLATRVGSELMPGLMPVSRTGADGGTLVEIPRRTDDHFVARVRVNGAPVEMMIDTGASNVVLTSEDAIRAGLDPDRLSYSLPVTTANGRTLVAPVQLRALAVGEIGKSNIEALVAQPGALEQSLLGMSFLNRLQSYEVKDGVLILRD
jgi:aspartyl protease family protein